MGFMSTLASSKTARAGLVAASALFGAASLGVTAPAYAQDAKPIDVAATEDVIAAAKTDTSDVTLETDCKTYRIGKLGADGDCLIAQGKILDKQLREKEVAYLVAIEEVVSSKSEARCTNAMALDFDLRGGKGLLTPLIPEMPADGQMCAALGKALKQYRAPVAG